MSPSSTESTSGFVPVDPPLFPLSPSAPVGPVGPAYPTQPNTSSSSTIPSNNLPSTSSPSSTMAPARTTLDDGSGQSNATSSSTTVDYSRFECIVRVSRFLGGSTGDSRRVKVDLRLSTTAVRYVWAETRWDDESIVQTVTLNPEGRIEFLVFAPGTQWPTVNVYAAANLIPGSLMCRS